MLLAISSSDSVKGCEISAMLEGKNILVEYRYTESETGP